MLRTYYATFQLRVILIMFKTASIYLPVVPICNRCCRCKPISSVLKTFQSAILATFLLGSSGAAYAEQITVGGTGSALGVMRVLMAEFERTHPEIDGTVLPSLGSGGGVKALLARKIDIAVTARPLKEKENNGELSLYYYGRSPLALVTFDDVGVSDLTRQDIQSIFAGETTHWPSGEAIRLVLRVSSETDSKLLFTLVDGLQEAYEKQRFNAGIPTAVTDQDNVELLSMLDGSFGSITLSQIRSEKLHAHIFSLDGIEASVANIKDGRYPLWKSYWIVTQNDMSPSVSSFLEFIRSRRGREILLATGHDVAQP